MYNKWWNLDSSNSAPPKEDLDNATLAASALVPLLLTNDAMRIYFRRCGLSETFHETLVEATTSTTDVSITTAAAKVGEDEETPRTRPTVSPAMLVTVLTALSAACRNRLVHEEFVKDFNGLNHVANVLSTAIVVDQSARTATKGTGKAPVKGALTNI